MLNRAECTEKTRKALNDLFYSLNDEFLDALKVYTIDLSDELHDSGVIYHDYTLDSLIEKFSDKYYHDLDLNQIQELKECNDIGCMNDYYDLIEYMITEIDL